MRKQSNCARKNGNPLNATSSIRGFRNIPAILRWRPRQNANIKILPMSIVLPNRNSMAQLENGASRIYLGAHYGFDNLQGQLLGLAVADMNIKSNDPAATKLTVRIRPFPSRESGISL